MTDTASRLSEDQAATVAKRADEVVDHVRTAFVGDESAPRKLLVCLFARGHVLLEGVPGVAKTTLAKAFASTLGCGFRRVQFTPDLLPTDITGTYVLSPVDGSFSLKEGPIFTQVVLGDEINRAPAKTQSALLEAMQEQQVTIDGETRPLPQPFIVIATQNPVEQAGTYPLPEAQIDRFLMRLTIGYPTAEGERAILSRYSDGPVVPQAILSPEEIEGIRALVDQVHVEPAVMDYVVALSRHTRKHPSVFLGASPRASLALLQAAKAQALIEGRTYVMPDHIKALAGPVLEHRLILTPEAQMQDRSSGSVVADALQQVSPHRDAGSPS